MAITMEKRKWHWLDTFLFIIRTSWMAFIGYHVILVYSDTFHKMILLLAFLCTLFVPYFFYRPGYIKIGRYVVLEFLLSGSMFLFSVMEFKEAGFDVLEILMFPLVIIAFVSQTAPLIWISPIIAIAILITGSVLGNFFHEADIIIEMTDIFIFYVFGYAIGNIAVTSISRKKLIESIEAKNKTLEQYAKKIEELTIIEERHRVSQDLHDTVGHIFTSVITSLDALPFLIKASRKEAKMYIKEITDLARNGLDDVRTSIYQLSPSGANQPLKESCIRLIEDFMKHTGTIVEFQLEGKESETGELTKYTIIRCLQESLTNAKRHGQATHIIITLSYTNDLIILEIKDNGTGTDQISLGFGLRSMKDRMITLGGSLHIESKKNQGTIITCAVPLQKDEPIVV
ncbi:sensor histidine kinase [Bacillus sp. M6-12]|uniref:sensor histidine kinase n=1 Tax=Bacillus sp. M6-12 TaxID=2054166 RepID=UPI0015E0B0B3|nr:sensor histidine kinase [Bacillus sp. M6-12]